MAIRLGEARQMVRQGMSARTAPGGTFRAQASGDGPAPTPTPDGGLPDVELPGGGPPGTGRPGTGGGVPEGFDPDTYGENPENNLPPGWVINPRSGGLIPPGGGEVQGPDDEIPIGAIFEMGGDYWQWNGRSITEASQDEVRSYLDSGAAGGGGGGGGSGVSWANLAQRQREYQEELRQNAFARQMDYITTMAQEEANADARRQNYVDNLLGIAPNMPAGNFYGGYGPQGGATLLELMQGGLGAPRPVGVMPVDVPAPRPANTGIIEQALGGLL